MNNQEDSKVRARYLLLLVRVPVLEKDGLRLRSVWFLHIDLNESVRLFLLEGWRHRWVFFEDAAVVLMIVFPEEGGFWAAICRILHLSVYYLSLETMRVSSFGYVTKLSSTS